ncbi:MAG: metal-dependent hydrolase [Lamprobacter sp.]|uniref:metal-dependent hydrolase n=1 Tax=Lamprobacter sp. TaxID=3100796 RepID=UPI002B258858|nr:metal-dependent hydrolase [Lamprobacter sp.]MEA3641176.1 metal-dependent hydrolase [Lamprobacter sp.]
MGTRPREPNASFQCHQRDTRSGTIGRLLRLTSGTLERYFGHRTFTHALLPQLVAAVLAWWLLPGGYAMALIAGWVSHSWCDMMTKSGVAWFWPARIRCVLPGNSDWRMDVAGGGELVFLLIMALIGALMMPLAATGKGTAGLIRGALGDLEMARGEYDRDKGTALFSVELKGRDNRTYTDVSGTYPIIGPWGTAGFILDTDSGPRSLCASSNCDWHASHAKIQHGEPIQTSSRPIQGATLAATTIREALQPLEEVGEVYLVGSVLLQGLKANPPTIEVASDTVRLIYARPTLLEQWQGKTLREVDLTAQVRHPPGAEVPELPTLNASSATIPPLLQRWITP